MSEGYNGFTNYQTYAISVWINNQEDEYSKWTERAKELLVEKEYDKSDATSELADEIEKDWEEKLSETGQHEGPLFDFMNDALNQVDWSDVAESFFAERDVYVVKWNQPGCLPEMEAMKFDNFDDARDAILDELNSIDDGTLDEEESTKYQELISEVENFTEPFTVEWDGYVYEVAKDE